MLEFASLLTFHQESFQKHFTTLIPEHEWGNRQHAELFLQKYGLSEKEYQSIWRPVQEQIFIPGTLHPQPMFRPGFHTRTSVGGGLFTEAEFRKLQAVMQASGDVYFIVIQHMADDLAREPAFRLKFPIAITWEELCSGNYISAILLEATQNEYYVFGTGAGWGRYVATDSYPSVDITGYKPQLANLFDWINDPLPESEQ